VTGLEHIVWDGFEVVITWIGVGLSAAEPHEF